MARNNQRVYGRKLEEIVETKKNGESMLLTTLWFCGRSYASQLT